MNKLAKQSYDKIINLIQIESRKLSEDDSYDLNVELRIYFNRLFESTISESHQPGDKVIYKGGKYEVVEEDEYIIKLKDIKTGKVIKVNYAQFKKQEMNESIYPLTTQVDKIADLMAQHNIGVDSINFVRSGKASEPWLAGLVRRLEKNGIDVSSIKAQPKSPQSSTSNPKPSIDPYEYFSPSKGYMGSSYRGD
jgi:hypothetical protein